MTIIPAFETVVVDVAVEEEVVLVEPWAFPFSAKYLALRQTSASILAHASHHCSGPGNVLEAAQIVNLDKEQS
jgi:hypothetical protein